MRTLGVLLAAWLALAPGAAAARWLKADTGSFSVYSEGDETRLRTMAVGLQRFDQLLRIITNVKAPPSPTVLPVYVLADNGAIRQVTGITSREVAGTYVASPTMIAALTAAYEARLTDSANLILFHEYAHHFMYQYASGAYPRWYVEGFAEFVGSARITADQAELGRFELGRLYPLLTSGWIPIEPMLRGQIPDAQKDMFYPQSWVMVHYINNDPARVAGLGRYLVAVGRGEDPVAAFEPAFGMSPATFFARIKAYAGSAAMTYRRMQWKTPAPEVRVTALPASADRLLLLALQSTYGVREAARPQLLAAVRKEAAKWPGDRYARTVLAQAEILYGDRAAGAAIVDALIAEAPDADAWFLRGVALARDSDDAPPGSEAAAAKLKAARAALGNANKLRPDDYRILATYAEASPRPLSDATLDVLLRARDLAPQVNEIGIMAAEALAERGRTAEALALLTPIMADAHDSPAAAAAAKLRDRIAGGPAATAAEGTPAKP